MTKRILTLPIITLSLFLMLLTACGGSGGGGSDAIVNAPPPADSKQSAPPVNDDNVNNEDEDDEDDNVNNDDDGAGGETDNPPPAPLAPSASPESGNRFANTDPTDTTDSVRASENGVLVFFAGKDYTFTGNLRGDFISDDKDNPARIRFADSVLSGYLAFDRFGLVIDGTDTDIQGTFYNLIPSDDSVGFLHGYGVAGVRTPSAAFEAQKATATYRGILELQKYQNPSLPSEVIQRVLTMDVDFNVNTISGESIDGSSIITFEQASFSDSIDGGEFNGMLTLDNAGEVLGISTGTAAGHYAGNFFGLAADDIAGVVRIQGAGDEGATLAIGGFRADLQP